ncbi:hypothetical protein OIO90_002201 [Microbotryomycetes sp. JL221]|nr:hypothetical protein OIO90_002201 [Microbotryomycetes sp. JL221]
MSSAHDRRAHVRHDSIAYRRTVPASPTKDSAQHTNKLSTKPSTTDDDKSKQQQQQQQQQQHQVESFKASHARLIAFYQLVQQRRLKLKGIGESHVLPKRWRQFNQDDLNSTMTSNGVESATLADGLPQCKRVLLFKFSNVAGFSSEMNLYLQASVIATKLGYTLLSDDSEWNFGHLRSYFVPRTIHCQPPQDWFVTSVAVALGSKRWPLQDRVWYGRELALAGDQWLRDEILDQQDMFQLKGQKWDSSVTILPQGQTLPNSLIEIFEDFTIAAKEVWKPNQELANLIQKQRMELGLGADKLLRHRKHSPTWGGTRKDAETNKEIQDETDEQDMTESNNLNNDDDDDDDDDDDGYEEDAGGAARSDRGPIISIQLGAKENLDKAHQVGLDKGRFLLQSRTTEGINDAVKRLTSSTIDEPSYSRSRSLFPTNSNPLIVMLTPNTSTIPTLDWQDEFGRPLTIESTSRPPFQELRRWNDILRIELTDSLPARNPFTTDEQDLKQTKITSEWDFKIFKTLPKSLQIYLTLYFVRDLTTMSLFSDAFVVHASTNTGRLACVLAGSDAVIGPRDIDGVGFGGRVRSVDVYWTPTSTIDGLWRQPGELTDW